MAALTAIRARGDSRRMKAAAAMMLVVLGATTAYANDRGDIPDEPERDTVVVTERGSRLWAGVAASAGLVGLGLLSAGVYYQASWTADRERISVSAPERGPITQDDCGRADIVDRNGVFASVCEKRDPCRSRSSPGTSASCA